MSLHRKVYIVGSLRNPQIPIIAKSLREVGHEVFDDWHSSGPEADVFWQSYEQDRGHSYAQALNGLAAKDHFEFDKRNLERADVVVLAMPAGKSAHLEFGWATRGGSEGHILFPEEPPQWDLMYRFAHGVWAHVPDLCLAITHGLSNIEH